VGRRAGATWQAARAVESAERLLQPIAPRQPRRPPGVCSRLRSQPDRPLGRPPKITKYGCRSRSSTKGVWRLVGSRWTIPAALIWICKNLPNVYLRACLKTLRGAAVRDFGRGQGGEVRASPQRAVRTEPTQPTDERPTARRVFAQQARWLRCSSVEDPPGIFSFVAPRLRACCAKTAPLRVFRQALRIVIASPSTSRAYELCSAIS